MEVINYKVGRIVPLDSIGQYQIGHVLCQPQSKTNPDYSHRKIKIEEVFESIRANNYPYLPSRQSSLFVFPIDDKKFEEEWLKILYPHQTMQYILLTLSLTGDLTWYDSDYYNDCLLFDDTDKMKEQAHKYWIPKEDYANIPQIEGLFVGEAIVERIDIKTFWGN